MLITDKEVARNTYEFVKDITCATCTCSFRTETYADVQTGCPHNDGYMFWIRCPVCRASNKLDVDQGTYKRYFAYRFHQENYKKFDTFTLTMIGIVIAVIVFASVATWLVMR